MSLPEVSWSELDGPAEAPEGASVRARVVAARLAGFGISTNAEIGVGALEAAVDLREKVPRLV